MLLDRRVFLALFPLPFYAAVPLKVLSSDEAAIVEALCAQIIPRDDDPGAKEAGVLYYIETQLAGPFAPLTGTYRKGLVEFSNTCLAETSKPFTALSFDEQKRFLQHLESQPGTAAHELFQLVIDHTMQGFYGSPKHGGNKDGVSWKMLAISDVMEGHKH